MISDYFSTFDQETKDVINYLRSRSEIGDVSFQEFLPAIPAHIQEWETKNTCILPKDMKNFYLCRNGVKIEWSIKAENDSLMPLGKIILNGIFDLTKVGTALQKDYKDPSLFDLEDIQEYDLTAPHFDERSRNFELDNCNGFGKVCLVYKNAKAGVTSENPEFWFLDRSLNWTFLASSFTNYYRLLISNLGLPLWQTLFTSDGLPPYLYQWYYLFTAGRVLIHENTWRSIDNQRKIKHNFDANKVFKEKDDKKKIQASQSQKASSAPNDFGPNNSKRRYNIK